MDCDGISLDTSHFAVQDDTFLNESSPLLSCMLMLRWGLGSLDMVTLW